MNDDAHASQQSAEIHNWSREFRLSDREVQIMGLMVSGHVSAEEIGKQLGVSPHTVKNHIKNMLTKTGFGQKAELLAAFTRKLLKRSTDYRLMSKRPRVLVVDDEPDICSVVEQDLTDRGMRVFTCTNPTEVMDLIATLHVDAVVSDIRMPGLDGRSLLKRIRATFRYLPIVIFITGYSEYAEEAMLREGAAGFFEKPIDFERLAATIIDHYIDSPFDEGRLVRIPTPETTAVMLDGGVHGVENLGFGGAFVALDSKRLASDPSLATGKTLEIQLRLLGASQGDPLVISAEGIIVWRRMTEAGGHRPGVGVKFINLGSEQKFQIEHFVRTHRITSMVAPGGRKS